MSRPAHGHLRSSAARARSRLLCLWVGLGALASVALAAEPGPIVIFHGAKGSYRAAAEALAAELRNGGGECVLMELPEEEGAARTQALERLRGLKPRLVAAGGVAATSEALQAAAGIPVVYFMVPNALDAPFLSAGGDAVRKLLAGVATDVGPADHMDWIKRTKPDVRSVAVLSSPGTQRTAAALEQAGRERGVTVKVIVAARDKFPEALNELSGSGCDGVLMIPDAEVYNAPNVERLLLWGARSKKAIWGFSESVVKAGAFAGLYSDPQGVGKQAAGLVRQILDGAHPETLGLQYAQRLGEGLRGAVNVHTAEVIGVPVDDRVFAKGIARIGDK